MHWQRWAQKGHTKGLEEKFGSTCSLCRNSRNRIWCPNLKGVLYSLIINKEYHFTLPNMQTDSSLYNV